jgi:hypothetical protein
MTVFWDVAPIALMMEAASTAETSVNFYQTTRRNVPEDSHPHTRCRENIESHTIVELLKKFLASHETGNFIIDF